MRAGRTSSIGRACACAVDCWSVASRPLACLLLALLCAAARPAAQTLPRGTIVDAVTCAEDPAQSYALYLPSDYTPDRPWSLLLAFHPGARGRAIVEVYQVAAERYGYIVAGSNNSRNGPWKASAEAVRALSRDVAQRFAIDAERVYATGHSGGARLAMALAQSNDSIAGVIASSAGFAEPTPRTSVRFPVFATAGTDDFNYVEMRRLDATLRSPHHLAVFDGGHALPPPAVAREAIEWLELQAMRSGRRGKDGPLIQALYTSRNAQVEAAADPVTTRRLLTSLTEDFAGLRDIAVDRGRLAALDRDPSVRKAVARDRADLDSEARALDEALRLEGRLGDADQRLANLARLETILADWARSAASDAASPARSRARRLLSALAAGAAGRTNDETYRALVQKYRWRS